MPSKEKEREVLANASNRPLSTRVLKARGENGFRFGRVTTFRETKHILALTR